MLSCTPSASGCWKNIVMIGESNLRNGSSLNSFFVGIVGDGSSINFWADSWLFDEPLRQIFPQLFRLEKRKWSTISDRLKVVNRIKTLHWEWTTAPTTSQQVADLFSLLSAIFDFDWKGGIDDWNWSADRSGLFSVNSVKKLLISNVQQLNNDHFRWKGWAPLKCKVMTWRATINRLPTKTELLKRGVPLLDVRLV